MGRQVRSQKSTTASAHMHTQTNKPVLTFPLSPLTLTLTLTLTACVSPKSVCEPPSPAPTVLLL